MTFYDAQVNLEEPAEDFGVGYHILYIKSPLRRKVLGVEGPQRTSGPMFSTLAEYGICWECSLGFFFLLFFFFKIYLVYMSTL